MDDRKTLAQLFDALFPGWKFGPGTWLRHPCLRIRNKVFAVVWSGDVAFKVSAETQAEALQVPGARLFDPRGQGRPLKGWVLIPAAQSSTWPHFTRVACAGVAGASQARKDQLIQGLVTARRKVLDAARSLSEAQRDEVFLGTWSAKDLLAHLAGWDDTNGEAVCDILEGHKPSFLRYRDRDWQSFNAYLVAAYRRQDWAEMVAVVQESHRRLIEFLQGVPADDYVRRKGIAGLLRTEARDEKQHARQVQAFIARPRG